MLSSMLSLVVLLRLDMLCSQDKHCPDEHIHVSLHAYAGDIATQQTPLFQGILRPRQTLPFLPSSNNLGRLPSDDGESGCKFAMVD